MARLNYLGQGLVGALVLATAVLGWSSVFTVEQKEAGVVTQFGAFKEVVGPGLHFRNPFTQSYRLFPISTQQLEINHSIVQTTDNQAVSVNMLVQYDVPLSDVRTLYERFPNYEQRMYSLANDRMKEVFGRYQVADIPQNRAQIEDAVRKRVSEDAVRLYGLQVTEIQITELHYSETFLAAVDNMTLAKANVTKAEQLRLQAQKDAERQQISAKANADAETLAAEAEAKAIRLKGEAEAASVKAQSEALRASPEMVQYEQARRWDGKLPTMILGSAPLPLMNINK